MSRTYVYSTVIKNQTKFSMRNGKTMGRCGYWQTTEYDGQVSTSYTPIPFTSQPKSNWLQRNRPR